MKLIVGLGNPGEKYASTRHNIGFMVIDHLSRELGIAAATWAEEEKHQALVARFGDVLLIKPLTFVNNSGASVKGLVNFYKLNPSDVWVIHDDLDLPLGKIRIRQKGGTAGHNGVASIINALKSDAFVRFRLGTGLGKKARKGNTDKNLHRRWVIAFVLSHFQQREAGEFKHLVKSGTEAVRIALTEGLDKAMNRFN